HLVSDPSAICGRARARVRIPQFQRRHARAENLMTSSLASLLGRSPRSTCTRPDATPPGPRPRYPGYFLKAIVNGKLELFTEMAAHGDVSQISIGPQRVVLLMHP